jgi:hypothetical protein
MRNGLILPARPAPYDRAPLAFGGDYSISNVAPHGSTTRWQVTVPAARKYLLDHAYAIIIRETVAAPVGRVDLQIQHTDIALATYKLPKLMLNNNTVGASAQLQTGYRYVVLPGENVAGQTADPSTGGTMSYSMNIHGVTFDA